MLSFTSLFSSVACLMAVGSAIPTTNAKQNFTDCAAGTWYYRCGEYNGCFSKSPCDSPTKTPESPVGQCPSASETKTHLAPSGIYDIFPGNTSLARGPGSAIRLETYTNASQVEQALIFTGIPTQAKNCSFGWKQGSRIERIFLVKGFDGVTEVKQLSGFPAEGQNVTYDSIKPFDTFNKNTGSLDFTNWDDLEAASHQAGNIDCAETLFFKTNLKNPDGNTKVYLGQDQNNGYHVTYSC